MSFDAILVLDVLVPEGMRLIVKANRSCASLEESDVSE
jgi:hypothetical protein